MVPGVMKLWNGLGLVAWYALNIVKEGRWPYMKYSSLCGGYFPRCHVGKLLIVIEYDVVYGEKWCWSLLSWEIIRWWEMDVVYYNDLRSAEIRNGSEFRVNYDWEIQGIRFSVNNFSGEARGLGIIELIYGKKKGKQL